MTRPKEPNQTVDRSPASTSDSRLVALLFCYGFGNAAAYVIARTIADSQFLSMLGPSQLPKVYVASAGLVALTSAFYSRLVKGASVRRSVVATLAILAAVNLALPSLLHLYPDNALAISALYLAAQVRGCLGTIQFTMLLNEHFARRQPERVVGIVGVGSTLAGFALGMALGQYDFASGLLMPLYAVAAIDVLTMIPVRMMPPGRKFRVIAPELTSDDWPETAQPSVRNSYVPRIAAVIAIGVLVTTIVEYQWKVAVAKELLRSEVSLAKYFGTFYGIVYLITGAIQLFVTSRILQQRGIVTGLLLFPSAMVAISATVIAQWGSISFFQTMTVGKGCDALRRGLYDPAMHIAYGPLSSRVRHQVVTLISGIVKPLAEAVASLLLLATAGLLLPTQLSHAVVILSVLWLLLAHSMWRTFTKEQQKPIVRSETEGDFGKNPP